VIQRVEIIAWRGDVETLALRLGCAPADLLAALRTMGRDVNRTPIKLNVDLANNAPVWAAVRRRLNAAQTGAGERPDLLDHPLRV